MAQNITAEKMIGCWKIKSISFLQKMDDSLEIVKSTKEMVICFEQNGKFTTKLKIGTSTKNIGTGTFNIDQDGKTLHQKRDADDGGIDEPAEVSMINTQQLSFKLEQLILYCERLTKQN